MRRTLFRRMAGMLLALTLAIATFSPLAAGAGETAGQTRLADVSGKNEAEREAAYSKMTFPVQSWDKGTVVAEKPLAVVIFRGGATDEVAARLRIWTGLLTRVGDDLVTVWDELLLNQSGKVEASMLDVEHGIPEYFAAQSQLAFRTVQYAGAYPWFDIPTDAEARSFGVQPFPVGTAASVYQAATTMIVNNDLVKPLALVPGTISEQPYKARPFPNKPIEREPLDINNHWAKAFILDLLAKRIINGYEDGTIRPNLTLTRAEFVTLLTNSLQLEIVSKNTFKDTATHWAKGYIAAALQAGIIEADAAGSFRPNDPITRLEMMDMLHGALQLLDKRSTPKKLTFKDTKGLSEAQLNALQAVTSIGLVQGYKDGTVQPHNSLKRAEAFVVVAKLLALP